MENLIIDLEEKTGDGLEKIAVISAFNYNPQQKVFGMNITNAIKVKEGIVYGDANPGMTSIRIQKLESTSKFFKDLFKSAIDVAKQVGEMKDVKPGQPIDAAKLGY